MSKEYGLITKEPASIPLTGVRITGDILGRSARVKLQQTFTNRESKPVEAVYKFPLPEGAAICSFKAHIDSRLITGAIEEREKAFEHYDEALARGDGAYLLDEERPNIFTLSVGNLNPGSSVLIEIEYVTLLDMEGPKVRFYLPTTISPRYIPADQPEEDGMPEDAKLHPPYAEDVPYGLSMLLNVHNGEHLALIESPTHPVSISMKDRPYQVSSASEEVKMDRDFILYLESEDNALTRAYRHRTNSETFIQLDLLIPKEQLKKATDDFADIPDITSEIVFLIDCSGSMHGDSIREAKKALGIFLKGLSPDTYFNIFRFGSTYESLFKKSAKYSEANLNAALSYLEHMEADLGGTEIFAPLKDIYSQDKPEGDNVQRDIVLLTDGEVSNEEQILFLARDHFQSVRVFPVGIGAGPNEFFIKALARNSHGTCEFIYPGERIEPKVLRIFPNIKVQMLTDFDIHWGGQPAEQAPAIPIFFLERPLTVFARVIPEAKAWNEIIVRGKIGSADKEWTIGVVDVESKTVPVSTLWARERIRDLEEDRGRVDRKGSRQRMRQEKHRHDMIVDLSKTYGVLSRSTSFVAVEERKEKDKTTGELVLRKIPVMVTKGWHGMISQRSATLSYKMSAPVISSHVMGALFEESMEAQNHRSYSISHTISDRVDKPRRDDKTDTVLSILALQKADGGLELTPEVAALIGMKFRQVESMTRDLEVEHDVDKFLLVSTALLLRVLETRYSQERAIWHKVVEKSTTWLKEQIEYAKPMLNGEDFRISIDRYVALSP